MSDFIRRTLQCPNCGHTAFGITNTGHIVCMQCMNSVKIGFNDLMGFRVTFFIHKIEKGVWIELLSVRTIDQELPIKLIYSLKKEINKHCEEKEFEWDNAYTVIATKNDTQFPNFEFRDWCKKT